MKKKPPRQSSEIFYGNDGWSLRTREKAGFHQSGNRPGSKHDGIKGQSCRTSKNRRPHERRTRTNQRTNPQRNVIPCNRETHYLFCPIGFGKIDHHQLSTHPESEFGILYLGNIESPARRRKNGVEYYFLHPDEFRRRISARLSGIRRGVHRQILRDIEK